MKKILTSTALAIFLATSVSAENVMEIAAKFDIQKIAAIQKYLEQNPDATDKDAALTILIGAHMSSGNFSPIPGFLDQRYEMQGKGAKADPQIILNEILRPYVQFCIVSDQRDRAKAFVTKLKTDLAGHPQAIQIAPYIDQIAGELYLPGVGDTMELTFTSMDGREVDLSKMKGKVVLIDFWATWCVPCVAEMPNLISNYEKYKEAGFEIVGISLDENPQAVSGFAEQKGLTWPMYFDGKGWENEIAQRFGIKSLPATFLVGKDGKIVAANLHGAQLGEEIAKALGSDTAAASSKN